VPDHVGDRFLGDPVGGGLDPRVDPQRGAMVFEVLGGDVDGQRAAGADEL
jgi:hypothetical protein